MFKFDFDLEDKGDEDEENIFFSRFHRFYQNFCKRHTMFKFDFDLEDKGDEDENIVVEFFFHGFIENF